MSSLGFEPLELWEWVAECVILCGFLRVRHGVGVRGERVSNGVCQGPSRTQRLYPNACASALSNAKGPSLEGASTKRLSAGKCAVLQRSSESAGNGKTAHVAVSATLGAPGNKALPAEEGPQTKVTPSRADLWPHASLAVRKRHLPYASSVLLRSQVFTRVLCCYLVEEKRETWKLIKPLLIPVREPLLLH